ncbi:MAG: polysaccharide deacetylase family protein [Janthinobacterium lividum]
MIGILYPQPARRAGVLVLAALVRSVGRAQAIPLSRGALSSVPIVVGVDVPDAWADDLIAWLTLGGAGRKLILFGRVPTQLAAHLGWTLGELPATLAQDCRSAPAPSRAWGASAAFVQYGDTAGALGGATWKRPFERFDFTNEWNNLGYGAIRCDDSPWSLAVALEAGSSEVAAVHTEAGRVTSYAALLERRGASIFWINRAIGSSDSFEWRLVENFIASHRPDELFCQPVLREVPWGYDAAVTSRLDCDEDVESARPLWNMYRELGVPFSLAVHTRNLQDPRQHVILQELQAQGEAVLSHTASHAPNWGGSYEAALAEGRESATLLREVTGAAVRYAVSPFHQTPPYALEGLADAGYLGCVGGIICNDPEFVLARGGTLAGMPDGFVGHSQQCMLHGECMLEDGDPLAIFKQAFDQAYAGSSLFGYLDHPFSARYAYGWSDEQVRCDAHRALIAHIRERSRRPIFMNENVAMDFLLMKSRATVTATGQGFAVRMPAPAENPSELTLAVDFKGEVFPAEPGGI